MKLLRFACLTGTVFLALQAAAQAQQGGKELRAIAEDGRKVLLGSDGRWRFDSSAAPWAPPSSSGESPYQTLLEEASVVFDTKKWSLAPATAGDPRGRRVFRHNTLPLYALVIAEEIPSATQDMRPIILLNARNGFGSEPTVLAEEYKQVQKRTVGHLKYHVVKDSTEFVFVNRFYADKQGNLQLACWTAQSIFHKYEEECLKLLDGLTFR